MKLKALVFAVIAILAATSVASGATVWHRLAHKTVSGGFATTVVTATAKKPLALGVKVKSKPSFKMRVDYDVVCTRGTSAATKTGHYTSYGLGTITPIPHPFIHPDSCTFSADAQLGGSGTLTIGLFKK